MLSGGPQKDGCPAGANAMTLRSRVPAQQVMEQQGASVGKGSGGKTGKERKWSGRQLSTAILR